MNIHMKTTSIGRSIQSICIENYPLPLAGTPGKKGEGGQFDIKLAYCASLQISVKQPLK